MEYWQKFSFITSFSKGLIGYSLRYSEEREAAVCMSRIVDWVEGVQGCVQGEELRTRQTGKYITEAEGEDFTYCGTLKAWLATRWEDEKADDSFHMRPSKIMSVVFTMWKIWVQNLLLISSHSLHPVSLRSPPSGTCRRLQWVGLQNVMTCRYHLHIAIDMSKGEGKRLIPVLKNTSCKRLLFLVSALCKVALEFYQVKHKFKFAPSKVATGYLKKSTSCRTVICYVSLRKHILHKTFQCRKHWFQCILYLYTYIFY